MTDFPHPSRPGYYGVDFAPELATYVSVLASALIPGDDHYPSGGDAQVSRFVEQRSSPADLQLLERMRSQWPAASVDEARDRIRAMEVDDVATFVWLREFVYHGYYASRRVLAAMADLGYDYHGAPQPLGYRIHEEMAMPSGSRGSYIPTEEVTRVSN
jgi:hypothetical protein